MSEWKEVQSSQFTNLTCRVECQSPKGWSEFMKKVATTCAPLSIQPLELPGLLIYECTFPPSANPYILCSVSSLVKIYMKTANNMQPPLLDPRQLQLSEQVDDDSDASETASLSGDSDDGSDSKEISEETKEPSEKKVMFRALGMTSLEKPKARPLPTIDLFAPAGAKRTTSSTLHRPVKSARKSY